MEFLKTYVYDHRITRTIKEDSPDNVEWNIEEVNPDNEDTNCKYQLAFKIKNKKYYVKTISYTGHVNPDMKQYNIGSIEKFITDVETELPNINFSIKFDTKNKKPININKNKEETDFSNTGFDNENNIVSKTKKLRM